MIQQFQYIFDFVGVDFAGYLLGSGNKPEDVKQDRNALFAAEQLNDRLKLLLEVNGAK